jgi:outer membrane receptor protein involved in Fe transport
LDLGLFNERISINIDYFVRNVFDKIAGLGISAQTGFTSYSTNLGKLQNKGIELAISGKILKSATPDGLNLEAGLNYFHVKSFAKKLPYNALPGNRTSGFFVWAGDR